MGSQTDTSNRTLLRVGFDAEGPSIGSFRLLKKSWFGFTPRGESELIEMFSSTQISAGDVRRLAAATASMARALNDGDTVLAAIIAGGIRLPLPTQNETREEIEAQQLFKASPDDPEHPGYPARTPEGKGGQFRPKETPGALDASDRTKRLERLARRKTLRSILSRVLSAKRIMRMIGKYVGAEIAGDIPVVNDVVGAASLKEDLELMADVAQDVTDSDAAIDFVNKGPAELSDLQRSPDAPRSFQSFDAFKKIELEKQYGPAGDGYDYHHIVEQGANPDGFTQEQLQSTENIIRIPRLLHEELNSFYGSAQSMEGGMMTPRAFLRGRSFEEQRQFGLSQLRRIGIIH